MCSCYIFSINILEYQIQSWLENYTWCVLGLKFYYERNIFGTIYMGLPVKLLVLEFVYLCTCAYLLYSCLDFNTHSSTNHVLGIITDVLMYHLMKKALCSNNCKAQEAVASAGWLQRASSPLIYPLHLILNRWHTTPRLTEHQFSSPICLLLLTLTQQSVVSSHPFFVISRNVRCNFSMPYGCILCNLGYIGFLLECGLGQACSQKVIKKYIILLIFI